MTLSPDAFPIWHTEINFTHTTFNPFACDTLLVFFLELIVTKSDIIYMCMTSGTGE